MANNSFTITISAVDKATATVSEVNQAIERLIRPFIQVGKSLNGLGRELGLDRVGRDLGYIGREAGSVAHGIGSIVTPMAALSGNWARLGRSIDNSAAGIGISIEQLQGFQGAARLAGISSETMTSNLDALATTMQNAKLGRDQDALLLFSKLGVSMDRTAESGNDVVGAFRSIADAISKETNPQVQALNASRLGLGGMLPFLRQGSAGIAEYQATVQRLGYVMSDEAVQRSKAFALSLAGLEIAIDGTKNAIGDALIPAIKPLADQFATWIAQNRELIAINVGEWARGFAQWGNGIDWKGVGQGIKDFTSGIGQVVDWLGGWKNAAIALAVTMNAGLILSVASLGLGMAKAGGGVLSFIGLLWKWQAAAKAALAAQGALSVGAAAGGLAAQAGLVGLAGAAGYGIGTLINKTLVEPNEKLSDAIGGTIATILANFGVKGAQEALDSHFNYLASQGSSNVLPRGIRNNNPGNLNFAGQAGARKEAGPNGHFAVFGSMPEGIAALDKQLKAYSARGINTIGKLVSTYAPAGDGNNVQAYAQFLSKSAGVGVNDPLDLRDQKLRAALIKGIAAHENGAGYITDAHIQSGMALSSGAAAPSGPASAEPRTAPQGPITGRDAQAQNSKIQVEVELKNAPEGTKARVKSTEGIPVSSRISLTGVGGIA